MSLRNFTEVDLIVRMPEDPTRTALVIYDGGEVPEAEEREIALQKKLAAYLEFVASGQFRRTHPDLSDTALSIEVVCLHPPTEGMTQVESIRDSVGRLSLPVNVTSDENFRARFRR